MLEDGFIALAVPAAAAEEDMEFIAEYDYSTGVSTIDFTDLGSYRALHLVGYLLSSADNNTAVLLLSTNNGSSFLSTGYTAYKQHSNTAEATTSFPASTAVGAWDTGDSAIFSLNLWNFDGQDADEVVFKGISASTAASLTSGERAAASYDAIRISLASNDSRGLLHLYGIPR